MSDTINVIAETREEAHQAASHAYALAQALIRDAKRVRFVVGEDQDPITLKQRGFLHAAVFPQIAEQVVVDGTRYTADVWKEFFRKRFLPDRWEMAAVPKWDPVLCRLVQPKRKTPVRVRVSTEDLGIKAYSDYIDRVIDTAVVELHVVFEFRPREREEVRYRPGRKPKAVSAAQQAEEATA